ncbi:Potassium-transporting ATPase potassium-binding subunit [Kitasatospora aureofaciens]
MNTDWYDTALGLCMVLGRFLPMVFVLALAGSLAQQQPVPATPGTLPTHKPLFVGLLSGVVLIVVGLTYFPALALGPLAEGLHLMSTHRSHPLAPGDQARRGLRTECRAVCSTRSCMPHVAAGRGEEARPPGDGQEPGHVRGRGRLGGHHVSAIADPSVFAWAITVWLWLTTVFANLAEAVAEGRGKAQADTLRKAKTESVARRLTNWPGSEDEEEVPGTALQLGDHVVVEAGQIIPGDGDVVEGVARSTSRRSPASPRRSSASPAVTAVPSPAAPRCCPTGSW